MIALGRYVTSGCLNSLRWVAPGLVFVLCIAITYGPSGHVLSSLVEGATWLFPIAAWLTVVTLNDEDPSQAAVTAVAVGGLTRARVGKLLVAGAAGALMTGISLVTAYATNSSNFTLNDLAEGTAAHLLSVIGGVAVGSLCARPLMGRTAWAAVIISALALLDVVIPYAPAHIVLVGLNRARVGQQWTSLGIGGGEVLVLAALLITGSSEFQSHPLLSVTSVPPRRR